VNIFEDEWDETAMPTPAGFGWRSLGIARRLGGELIGASLYEIPPGKKTFPYHWHAANEELLLVVDGRPTLRSPAGERELERGELVAFPASPDGAHQLRNDGEQPARVLMLSTRLTPEILEYPDTGKVGLASVPGQRRLLRIDAEIGYWDGEA
jgi:uncharacterized cupin superfamily protein